MNEISPGSGSLAAQPAADLTEAVRRLSTASVLVVGDAMLDRYVYGQVSRISPEAPVPVLAIAREVAIPGGAGNVVRNLTALGAAVAFISVVGDDQAGSDLTGLIGGQPGVEPWMLMQGARTTTVKTRFLAAGQHLLRADLEETAPIHPKLAERMVRIALDAMAATSVTVLSDYRKGVLAGDRPAELIAAARRLGRPVLVDGKDADYSRYANADVVTPNRRELAAATGMPVDTEAAVVAAATSLRNRYGFGAVLVTRGEDGITLVDAGGVRHFAAEAAEVCDVSGAGDTVVAVLAAALGAGLELAVAARLASIAGGLVVGKAGPAVAREADLLAALSPEGSTLRKIVSVEAATEQVERWRRLGGRIGFTNGCFDLLQAAHVQTLEEARAGCDRLVVGLNSDASVARLKGPGRPVQPATARAEALAGQSSVDLVCVFEEDTPELLIRALRPDLLVKGADYTVDRVVGADLVRGWGGQVMVTNLLPGHAAAELTVRVRG